METELKDIQIIISSQTLATKVDLVNVFSQNNVKEIEIDDVVVKVEINKN